jgi:hypothetical protein
VDQLAKDNKPIKDYWLVVMENYFQEDLSAEDKEIAKAIVDISTDVTA